MAGYPDSVRIREVGPRDGFQNEPEVIATADKVRLIEMLIAAGLKRIEVTSFVRADVIPQLAPLPGEIVSPKRAYGAFDFTGAARRAMLESVDKVTAWADQCVREANSNQMGLFGGPNFDLPFAVVTPFSRLQNRRQLDACECGFEIGQRLHGVERRRRDPCSF